MKPSLNNASSITNKSIYGTLLIVFCMVIVTLSEPLMPWVWVLSICTIVISFVRIKCNLPCVRNITLNLLAIFCMALLIYLSSNFGLIATMVNLLAVAVCLKLINLDSRADYHLVLIVLFFLIACGFIYHQSIYFVAYYFACLVILFVTAFLLNKGAMELSDSIKQSIKMMLQALPITFILFIVTPRLPPFWQANAETNTQTGLSEQITPGDIANLAQSADLVFRAEFDNEVPAPQQRYWRSIVLDYFDGKTWRVNGESVVYEPDMADRLQVQQEALSSLADYRYLVVAQANNTRWLYSLDVPFVEENMGVMPIRMNSQYQLFQPKPNTSASLYIAQAFTNYPMHNFTPETDFKRYLQAPLDSNKRTQKWVKENIEPSMDFEQKVATLNNYFESENFSYTLKPPLMPSSPIDAFLFDNQSGFCSHYASALTYMLRLANIPARMVAGYQGGEEQGNGILTVRQFDAHAWVEAYHKDYGWVRFDPTALVAPNRTLSGLLSALNGSESAMLNNEINGLFSMQAFDGLREIFTIIDHNWHQFVLEFNQDAQSSLIERIFGELSKKNLTTFLLLAICAIAILLALIFLPYKKWLKIKQKTALEKVIKSLRSKGFEREKQESLQHFYNRIESQLPDNIKSPLLAFVETYYQYKYQPNTRVSEKDLMDQYARLAQLKYSKKS
jgi:transglutaminase-like putative cysteine protease